MKIIKKYTAELFFIYVPLLILLNVLFYLFPTLPNHFYLICNVCLLFMNVILASLLFTNKVSIFQQDFSKFNGYKILKNSFRIFFIQALTFITYLSVKQSFESFAEIFTSFNNQQSSQLNNLFPWTLLFLFALVYAKLNPKKILPLNFTILLKRVIKKKNSLLLMGAEIFARQSLIFNLVFSASIIVMALISAIFLTFNFKISPLMTASKMVVYFIFFIFLQSELFQIVYRNLAKKYSLLFLLLINATLFTLVTSTIFILFNVVQIDTPINFLINSLAKNINARVLSSLFFYAWWYSLCPVIATEIAKCFKDIPNPLIPFIYFIFPLLIFYHAAHLIPINHIPDSLLVFAYLGIFILFISYFRHAIHQQFNVLIYKQLSEKKLTPNFLLGFSQIQLFFSCLIFTSPIFLISFFNAHAIIMAVTALTIFFTFVKPSSNADFTRGENC